MDVFSCLCTHLTILIGCRISWISPCWVMEILVFLFLEHCYNMQLKPKRRKLFEVISFYDLLGRSATRSALVQFSSVTQSWPTLWDPMNDSMPGLPVHHQLLESTQTHVPLIWWCHPTISSSVILFSSCLQSFPASRSFTNESVPQIRWPKYWSFSFIISPSN